MSGESKKRRGPYEFSQATKDMLHTRANGRNTQEIHHIVSIKLARQLGLCPTVIRSSFNAIALTEAEHRAIHRGKIPRSLKKKAEAIIKAQPRLPGL